MSKKSSTCSPHRSIDDRLGIPVSRDGDTLRYAYPVAILAARRA